MADVLGNILAFAVGIAISPVPIIAVILMLFSSRARVNGLTFLLGWIVGVSAVTVIVILLGEAGDLSTDSGTQNAVSIAKLVLGAFLILLGIREWRKRPAPGTEAEMPKWMSTIDQFTPVKALGTGFVLSALNPKNLVLAAGAGAVIAQAAGLSTSKEILVTVVFVAIASSTIAASVGLYLLGGERAKRVLEGWKVWLAQNNATVMAVLLVVIGTVLFGKGFDVFD